MIRFHVEKTAPGQPMPIHALDEQHLPRTIALLNVPKDFPFSADKLADNLASILNNRVPLRLDEAGAHQIHYVRFAGGLELRSSAEGSRMTKAGGAVISLTTHNRQAQMHDTSDNRPDHASLLLERLNKTNMQLLCDATIGHKTRIMALSAGGSDADRHGYAP